MVRNASPLRDKKSQAQEKVPRCSFVWRLRARAGQSHLKMWTWNIDRRKGNNTNLITKYIYIKLTWWLDGRLRIVEPDCKIFRFSRVEGDNLWQWYKEGASRLPVVSAFYAYSCEQNKSWKWKMLTNDLWIENLTKHILSIVLSHSFSEKTER